MRIFSILFLCSFLIACEGRSANAEMPLQEKCDVLNAESEEEYQVVSGLVEKSDIAGGSLKDCVIPEECAPEIHHMWTRTTMTLINRSENKEEKSFSVITPPESPEILKNKSLYFKEGNKYIFCARKANNKITELSGYDIFYLDDIKMLNKLK